VIHDTNETGVGDTFGTCFGPLSRNRKFGYRLGQGETMSEILESTTEVAEGVDTALAVVRLIEKECKGYRLDLKYPILFGIARILEGKQTPLEGLEALMNMPMQMENFDEGRTTLTRGTKLRRQSTSALVEEGEDQQQDEMITMMEDEEGGDSVSNNGMTENDFADHVVRAV
jgi:hypothetical protein